MVSAELSESISETLDILSHMEKIGRASCRERV